jgi:hypothetical protein
MHVSTKDPVMPLQLAWQVAIRDKAFGIFEQFPFCKKWGGGTEISLFSE